MIVYTIEAHPMVFFFLVWCVACLVCVGLLCCVFPSSPFLPPFLPPLLPPFFPPSFPPSFPFFPFFPSSPDFFFQSPDNSPYRGSVWELDYSTINQAMDFDARSSDCQHGMGNGEYEKNIHVMVDDLAPHGKDNPFWCTYAQAANAAFLIRTDGVIDFVQVVKHLPTQHTP
jgi:hypothetical protein